MNRTLTHLAREAGLDQPRQEPLRLAFGLACVERVEHLLEDPKARECLAVLRDFVRNAGDRTALARAAATIAEVANSHRGSNSIDGTAHAAVSSTYAVANALAGRALEAASYAAYATVYSYGGYAVTDPAAFEGEFAWQVDTFKSLRESVRESELVVRPARVEDAAGVAACVCSAYLHYIERIGRQPGPMLQDYAQVIATDPVHVAVQGGTVVGAIVTRLTEEGFYIDNVAVRPSMQGHGIGRKLLELAESEARRQGFSSLYLATHELMTENRALYESIGYVQFDHRTVNGFPRVFLRKPLA